jgi:hypothetical protein
MVSGAEKTKKNNQSQKLGDNLEQSSRKLSMSLKLQNNVYVVLKKFSSRLKVLFYNIFSASLINSSTEMESPREEIIFSKPVELMIY